MKKRIFVDKMYIMRKCGFNRKRKKVYQVDTEKLARFTIKDILSPATLGLKKVKRLDE